ncbi:hypothetical protein bsdtw1_01980 [Clostridium fungisolvens]|uniref:Uncharacterized protein n=1 Tax=Clostridium fungisolvens TaxID=1604897 RepID=A0A6V8SL45_9CLOT|nr:hypothetical protein bsdtw1_01980 [Clostridium fungisolvens]
MYDLKRNQETNDTSKETDLNKENDSRNIGDRAYYRSHLTDSVLYTKSSYVPTESLF